jgi:ribosomal protein S28E/S33
MAARETGRALARSWVSVTGPVAVTVPETVAETVPLTGRGVARICVSVIGPVTAADPVMLTEPEIGCVAGKLLTDTEPLTGCVAGRLETLTVPDTGCVAGQNVPVTGVVGATARDTG